MPTLPSSFSSSSSSSVTLSSTSSTTSSGPFGRALAEVHTRVTFLSSRVNADTSSVELAANPRRIVCIRQPRRCADSRSVLHRSPGLSESISDSHSRDSKDQRVNEGETVLVCLDVPTGELIWDVFKDNTVGSLLADRLTLLQPIEVIIPTVTSTLQSNTADSHSSSLSSSSLSQSSSSLPSSSSSTTSSSTSPLPLPPNSHPLLARTTQLTIQQYLQDTAPRFGSLLSSGLALAGGDIRMALEEEGSTVNPFIGCRLETVDVKKHKCVGSGGVARLRELASKYMKGMNEHNLGKNGGEIDGKTNTRTDDQERKLPSQSKEVLGGKRTRQDMMIGANDDQENVNTSGAYRGQDDAAGEDEHESSTAGAKDKDHNGNHDADDDDENDDDEQSTASPPRRTRRINDGGHRLPSQGTRDTHDEHEPIPSATDQVTHGTDRDNDDTTNPDLSACRMYGLPVDVLATAVSSIQSIYRHNKCLPQTRFLIYVLSTFNFTAIQRIVTLIGYNLRYY